MSDCNHSGVFSPLIRTSLIIRTRLCEDEQTRLLLGIITVSHFGTKREEKKEQKTLIYNFIPTYILFIEFVMTKANSLSSSIYKFVYCFN